MKKTNSNDSEERKKLYKSPSIKVIGDLSRLIMGASGDGVDSGLPTRLP